MINTTCVMCKHYRFGRTCKAFPEHIPDAIWDGENDHKKPLKGQKNDITFKPADYGNN